MFLSGFGIRVMQPHRIHWEVFLSLEFSVRVGVELVPIYLRELTSVAIWAWSCLLEKVWNYKLDLFVRHRAIKIKCFFWVSIDSLCLLRNVSALSKWSHLISVESTLSYLILVILYDFHFFPISLARVLSILSILSKNQFFLFVLLIWYK